MLSIGGVAMDLVGAGVLSHAHNAESIVGIRAEIGAEKSAVGEKRIGFFILTFGLTMYLIGLVLKSPEGFAPMAALAASVVVAGLIVTVLWTRIVGKRVRVQAARAERKSDAEKLPEQ